MHGRSTRLHDPEETRFHDHPRLAPKTGHRISCHEDEALTMADTDFLRDQVVDYRMSTVMVAVVQVSATSHRASSRVAHSGAHVGLEGGGQRLQD